MSDKPTRKPSSHRIALRCPEDVYQAIVAAAEREHRTVSNMVVELARRGLASPAPREHGTDLLQARTLEALRHRASCKDHWP